MLTRIKGTQDILDLTLQKFLLNKVRKHLAQYNFSEIMTPILERAELFQRAVGQETDIVSKEMYFIEATQEDDERTTLRPEITASIVRAYLNNNIQQVPWKVFSYGSVFRHERPQKGRWREFEQISIEVIGTQSVASDAYFITMLDRLFHEGLKLEQYALVINYLGCKDDRANFRDALYKYLSEHEQEICATCKVRKEKNILRVLDCKNEQCKALYAKAPVITDSLCGQCMEEWKALQNYLQELSVSFTHSPMLVRGLDYYEKTIFEFVDMGTLGSQSAFCGAGRYELAQAIGNKNPVPSMGAGIGVGRLVMMLDAIKDRLPLEQKPALHLVVPFNQEQYSLGLQVADDLHAKGLCVDILAEGASLKSMLRKANDLGATTVILLGVDEQKGGYATVKYMKLSTEEKIALKDLAATLNNNH
jgi:histidyl-tRNA synthetase